MLSEGSIPELHLSSRAPTARRREHVAIVQARFADLLVAGVKTIESRLSKMRGPAFDRVEAGDIIYFKEAGGGFCVSSSVQRALHLRDLRPAGIAAIREIFGEQIAADAAYWRSRRTSRYATLIWLSDVRTNLEGPALWRWPGFRDRSAWGTREIEEPRASPKVDQRASASNGWRRRA
jgi:hypothetical protein